MRSLLLITACCAGFAFAAPAEAAMVIPAVMAAPAAPEQATPSPLLQKVWWDRWHHWHRGYWWGHRWHRYPRPRAY